MSIIVVPSWEVLKPKVILSTDDYQLLRTASKPKKYSVSRKANSMQEEKPCEVTPKQMRNKRLGGLFFPLRQTNNRARIIGESILPAFPPFQYSCTRPVFYKSRTS